MYIYPPESYNNTLLYSLYNTFHSLQPQNNSTDDISQLFPFDTYNFFNNFIQYKDDNYILLFFELILFENVFATLCMKFSIME